MYRLLIVDDEEIITDGLFEVFSQIMPEELDVLKAYSAKEALNWLSRTRVDIVLTDVRMPGMSGLELCEEIRTYWPMCRIVILTGYSEFEYAYKAIQMPNVRYLLKTEGYSKVTETIKQVIEDINHSNQMDQLVERSIEQMNTLQKIEQADYFRHLLQQSDVLCADKRVLAREFSELKIKFDYNQPVIIVLGHLSFPEQSYFIEQNEIVNSVKVIWHSFFAEQTTSIGILDQYKHIVWLVQPSPQLKEKFGSHLVRYLEGTLELVQQACAATLNIQIGFSIGATSCDWPEITQQYERLRQLQFLKIGDGISMIVRDDSNDVASESAPKYDFSISKKVEVMAAHLELGREQPFFEQFKQYADSVSSMDDGLTTVIEAYYAVAIMLLSHVNRIGLQDEIGDFSKLMRLEEHASIVEGFQYIEDIAKAIFKSKNVIKDDRTSRVIDHIQQYIEDHLHEDLSLVRLAEVHYFNPSYLSRFFKQECGINLSVYIDQRRMEKAKELLKDRQLKIREVAARVGYEAAHSFTRFFKKETGLTPQEYRDSITLRGE